MSILLLLGLIVVAGGIGGLINSLINDKGFVLPHAVPKGDGTSILLPGFVGNILIGAVAATVSWLLYGPFNQSAITSDVTLTLGALGGAILVGMAGSGWLSNAVDKNVYRTIASQAVSAPAAPDMAQQILHGSPIEAMKLIQNIGGTILPRPTPLVPPPSPEASIAPTSPEPSIPPTPPESPAGS
jgi:hypothetical protein